MSALCSWLLLLGLSGCGGGGEEPMGEAQTTAMPAGTTSVTSDATAQILNNQKAAPSVSVTPKGYYVDAVLGSDANDGSLNRPWRSLRRAAQASLVTGEGLYLRCGQVWRESLNLGGRSWPKGAVVAGYGPECATQKARISGADDFSRQWVRDGDVWVRGLPAGTAKVTQVFVNGQALRLAQWPDAGMETRKAALLQASQAATPERNKQLRLAPTDELAVAGRDLVGATAQIRTQPWFIESRRVVSVNQQLLQLEAATRWDLMTGQGLVFQDKHWMLDQPGEFFHDVANQKLYLIPPEPSATLDLNSTLVEASVRSEALAVHYSEDLQIRDLELHAATDTGLRLTNSPGARVVRIEANANGAAGLRLQQWVPLPAGARAITVEDSQFADNGQYGIDATHVTAAAIQRNRVVRTGVGKGHQANVVAAVAAGPGARIEGNTVDTAGYHGVMFSSLGGSRVSNNRIKDACMRLTDCGAIYTWTGRDAMQPTQSSEVVGNIVSGGQANTEGIAPGSSDFVAGIYIDDFSNGVQILDNWVAETEVGIFVHNASRTSVRSNRVWLVSRVALWASMDQQDADWMTENLFEGNELAPVVQAKPTQQLLPDIKSAQVIWFWHSISGRGALGPGRNEFRNNRALELQGPAAAFGWMRGPGEDRRLSSTEWLGTVDSGWQLQRSARFAPTLPITGRELVSNSDFSLGLAHWGTWHAPSSSGFAATAWTDPTQCPSGCVHFQSGHRGDLLSSSVINLRAGTAYVYQWRATAPPARSVTFAAPYISRDGGNWDGMQDARGFVGFTPLTAAAGETLEHEVYFVAKETAPARVIFQMETLGEAVKVRRASVRAVSGFQIAKTSDWAQALVNDTALERTVDCAALAWPSGCSALDSAGKPLTLPMVLAPRTSALVLRADSPFRR